MRGKGKIRRIAGPLGMAAASGLACLALFGTGTQAVSHPASTAATNLPDLTQLPLGDGKSTTAGPGRGILYLCRTQTGGGGAQTNGPWIKGTVYDLTAKYIVDGSVSWPQAFFRKKLAKKLKLTGNGLPTNHTTGTFPVAANDDAAQIDRNPNTIKAQSIALALAAKPKRLKQPQCAGGEVGIARNGVAIFNAVDAEGRDAVAHEVQDHCSGHPQGSGVYHYHGLPACLASASGNKHSKQIGWAFDGFPIMGPLGAKGRYTSNADLDVCHGHAHRIKFNGETRKLFHYHANYEFPYTVGCYRGTAVNVVTGGGGGPTGPPPAGP